LFAQGAFSLQGFATFVIKLTIMVERIRTLLETRQLTPTQFADAIGVARPIVSHILSGRNKPSLEVVQRILAAMPGLSMHWLLNGTGPMLTSDVEKAAVQLPTPPITIEQPQEQARETVASHKHMPSTDNQQFVKKYTPKPQGTQAAPTSNARPSVRRFTPQAVAPAIKAAAVTSSSPKEEQATAQPTVTAPQVAFSESEQPYTVPSKLPEPANEVSAGSAAAAALFAGTEKPIRRIVIFYRDGSFADYQPE
jgi:transcriptional regulator with XRE-family HTH domain